MKSQTIFSAFEKTCRTYPGHPAFFFKKDNSYQSLSYQKTLRHSIALGQLLLSKGVKKDDAVAIILENSPIWPITFMAIMYCGARAVPLNHQLNTEDLLFFLSHSCSKYAISSSNICSESKNAFDKKGIDLLFLDSLKIIETLPMPQETQPPLLPQEKDTASILYTSGTTQEPKGVMLTHKNLLANIDSIKKLNLIKQNDCLISILPLYHSYPLMVNMLFPLLAGAKISYPSQIELSEIITCIHETKVSIMVSVPRLLCLLHEKIKERLSKGRLQKIILAPVLKAGFILRKYFKINTAKVLLKKLHAMFGEHFNLIISGGAKLDAQLSADFYKWGFSILQGYGLTETAPIATFNLVNANRFDSVGKPVPGVQIKISAADKDGVGEIIIKGDNVFSEYYQQDDLTRSAIKNGWFFTKDLGYKDKDGFIYITGRKNEMLILSSGKNIIPQELETHYCQSPFIAELCIFLPPSRQSTSGGILTAVIVPDYVQFQKRQVVQIKDRIRLEIENLSKKLPPYKRIKKYAIISENLPKTALGKLKRHRVKESYSGLKEEPCKAKPFSAEDKELLSYPACEKALKYLSDKFKRPIHLHDHLELDLGLDSLAQIDLFIEFQKVTGIEVDEQELTSLPVIRNLFQKIKTASGIRAFEKKEISNWQKTLTAPAPEEIKESISIRQSPASKIVNILFILIPKLAAYTFFLLAVRGKNNLPKHGPYLLCPNHTSYLDGPLLALSLPYSIIFNTYFIGFAALFKHPLLAWTNKLLRLIPIDPASSSIEGLKACAFVLNNSKIACLFAEGGRSANGVPREFKRGAGILIKELNIPVVPVYIKGTYNCWPMHKIMPKPGKVTITFGKPVTLPELSTAENNDDDIYKTIVVNLRKKIMELSKYNSS